MKKMMFLALCLISSYGLAMDPELASERDKFLYQQKNVKIWILKFISTLVYALSPLERVYRYEQDSVLAKIKAQEKEEEEAQKKEMLKAQSTENEKRKIYGIEYILARQACKDVEQWENWMRNRGFFKPSRPTISTYKQCEKKAIFDWKYSQRTEKKEAPVSTSIAFDESVNWTH